MAEFSEVTLGLCRGGVDYTVRQLAVLVKLLELPTAPSHKSRLFQALARDLEISKPAMTRTVNRLVEDGLALRGAVAEDQRQLTVDLTAKGAEFIAANRFAPAPPPVPAWWVLTMRASDEPWMVGPFATAAKGVRWGEAARNFAGSNAARRVVQCAATINPMSPEEGTRRAKEWADTAAKPAAA